jgi:phosphoheptose isomerase
MLDALLSSADLSRAVAAAVRGRDSAFNVYFTKCARDLAAIARAIEERLHRDGRVYCFGRGAYALDAADFAAALPAADVSVFRDAFMPLLHPNDTVVAFGPARGDITIERAVFRAKTQGAYTIGFPGEHADANIAPICEDEHLHQESLALAAHAVAETVGTIRKRRAEKERAYGLVVGILRRVADAAALRHEVAARQADAIAASAETIVRGIVAGGRLLLVASEDAATGAARWAWDCVEPPDGLNGFAAVAIAAKPAVLDSQIRRHDVVVALSLSAASRDLCAMLDAARRKGNATIAMLGDDGAGVRQHEVAAHTIAVPSPHKNRVAEVQAAIYHTIRHAVLWLRHE